MLVASLKDRNADHPHATTTNGKPLGDNQQLERSDTVLPPHWIRDSAPPPPFGPGVHVDLGIFGTMPLPLPSLAPALPPSTSLSHSTSHPPGTTYLWEVLHKHQVDDVGIDLLTETSYPSFGRMIDQGATTLWEVRRLLAFSVTVPPFEFDGRP